MWVDSPLLANGVHVELRRASGVQPERRLFAGRITVVIARFPTSTTPHVEVRAESARHADGPPGLPLIIHWGAELQELKRNSREPSKAKEWYPPVSSCTAVRTSQLAV